jgi:signal transduction histidine kinase
MLGRQQIFGIPAAIHELFKNAHDAYASHVQVDYFRSERVLVLRDDGIGMTDLEFESRWLTLGTEAKVGANENDELPWLAAKRGGRRTILGEKGIGRLAIAAIGPQVLAMTRAVREHGHLHDLVMALVHWGLFELPGIDLDQIEIPVCVLPGGQLPRRKDVKGLVRQIQANVKGLASAIDRKARDRLIAELDAFDVDPADASTVLGSPSLADQGHGTHFFVSPTYPFLEDDVNEVDADDVASPLQKMLLGFTNTMMPDRPEPPTKASFRDHRADGTVAELIAGDSFFTPEEFQSADHHFEGEFDGYGQFTGYVSVYGKARVAHTINWPGAQNRKTECGPFRIKVAYVQGKPTESRLPPDSYTRIVAKLNKIGGLYIYRDGSRILPYGNSDFDFLNIERRRTKSAQDWFFSYRRMFGAVEITHSDNPELEEKAGREGFRANTAFRQFTAILEGFFTTLALDFFRESGRYAEDWLSSKQEMAEQDRILKKREKSAKEKKHRFATALTAFFQSIEQREPEIRATNLREEIAERLGAIEKSRDREQATNELLRLEAHAKHRVADLREHYRVVRPSGIGLTKAMASDWQAYTKNQSKIETEIIDRLDEELETMINNVAYSGQISLDRRRRIDSALGQASKTANSTSVDLRRQCIQVLEQLTAVVRGDLRGSLTEMDAQIRGVLADFERSDLRPLDRTQLNKLQRELEGRVKQAGSRATELLRRLRDQLQSQIEALREGISLDDVTAAVEEKSEAYREELDVYLEWAQVGMALGVIQHEFASTVNSVRTCIQQLRPWAAGTPELRAIYNSLHTGFEHLDGYLALFTPLRRRLYRKRVPLSGEEIRKYLCEVFGARLERHTIRLKATAGFDRKTFTVFPSTFLPCFVNLIDNAIYWLSTVSAGLREIRLDADGRGFTIENSGPGIERRLADRIFEFGVSLKPSGRGMGLSISRQALRREGYDLTLENPGKENCPRFRIGPAADLVPDPKES